MNKTCSTPEDRVRAFIADFDRAHAALNRKGDFDFDRWSEAVAVLDAEHFTPDGGSRLAGSFADPSPHPQKKEKILATRQGGGKAVVDSFVDGISPVYFEYSLCAVAADWRLVRIREYLIPVDAPLVAPKDRSRFEIPKPRALRGLSAEDAHFNGTAIFTAGRYVRNGDETAAIEVRHVGKLNVTTGVLVVGDLAYGPHMLAPVGLRVPPGHYDAELSIAFDHILGMRVVLSEQEIASWHPADLHDGNNGVSVDAANVCIADSSGILQVKSRDKDRLLEPFAEDSRRTHACMLSLANPDDTVIAVSGNGDGCYPAFWGMDARGQPAALAVCFIDLPSA